MFSLIPECDDGEVYGRSYEEDIAFSPSTGKEQVGSADTVVYERCS